MEKSQLVPLGKTKLLFQSLPLLLYNGFIPKSANFQWKKGPRHIACPPGGHLAAAARWTRRLVHLPPKAVARWTRESSVPCKCIRLARWLRK